MKLNIQITGLPRASALRRAAAHKIEAALARYAHRVQAASVRLDDINGPNRGGLDKLCRVVLRMTDGSTLVIEEVGANFAQVIERVADRLRQSVARQLSRIIRIDRHGIRPALAELAS